MNVSVIIAVTNLHIIKMDIIVQWATILSPIIAVLIAWWMSRSSAKDTAKQIAALEENTTKQIESIKELSKQQIEASIKQVELEIEKNLLLATQAKQEWEGIEGINNSGMSNLVQYREIRKRQLEESKPERDYHLYSKFIKNLETIKRGLEVSKKNLS